MTTFEEVLPLADTVLYEGYALYPYRASDPKNAVRWQFGVLMSPEVVAADPSERSSSRTECLVDGYDPDADHEQALEVRVRFLQVQRRTVEVRRDVGWSPVEELAAGEAVYRPWDEAVEQEAALRVTVADALTSPQLLGIDVPGGREEEPVPGTDPPGRLVRQRQPLTGRVTVSAEPLPGPYGAARLRVLVENLTPGPPDTGPGARPARLRSALVAAHVLVRATGVRFLSLLDPPEWARPYAERCSNAGTFPVLAGPPGSGDMVLSSPIILYDHAQVAPESSSTFFDGTEIDEMLTLRTMTLTEEEQREARGTDPRLAALMDDVGGFSPELADRLHGTIRYLEAATRPASPGADAAPDAMRALVDDRGPEYVEVAGVRLGEGSRVLLRPGGRSADAQDLFLAGREATVTAVIGDLDGATHLAVVLDDDPGQDLMRTHGRYLYFAPEEVEPVVTR